MVKNVTIDRDTKIRMDFDSFYELNKEYESPYYTLKYRSGDWVMENPVNFSFYPPKNATKLILELKNLNNDYVIVTEPRIAEIGTFSYMRVKFPDIGSIDIRQNIANTNNPYEYTLKNDTTKLNVVIEGMEIYSTEISETNDQTINFLFTFK